MAEEVAMEEQAPPPQFGGDDQEGEAPPAFSGGGSRMTFTGGNSEEKGQDINWNQFEMGAGKMFPSKYDDVDVDELLEQLSPEELELLAGDVDPDDSLIPPQDRCAYKCEKEATGQLDRKHLIDHINEASATEPDRPELVPYVPGTVRGKVYVPPPPPVQEVDEDADALQVEVEIDEEFESVLSTATEDEIVDLAAVLGFHSMMNQDQYHASLLNKDRPAGMGWGGITKATKYNPLPAEPPNDTDPEKATERLTSNDTKLKELNLNNIRKMSDELVIRFFKSLENNSSLEVLNMANTGICDRHLPALIDSLSENHTIRTFNLETNNISPNGILRLITCLNKTHTIEDIKLANQQQSVLGNKIEMLITEQIEQNNTLLRVGLHWEFNDARSRVSRQLQKNLDTFRIIRIGKKSRNFTGGYLAPLAAFMRLPTACQN